MSSRPSKPEITAFCTHSSITAFPLTNSSVSYCPTCSSLIISAPETSANLYLIKPINLQKKSTYDPIESTLSMKSKALKYKTSFIQKPTTWYIKNRKRVIKYLQKLTLKMRFSDSTFYLSLFYLDQIFNTFNQENHRNIEDNLDYYILAVFLIISKVHEHDIFEPDLNEFDGFNGERLDIYEIKKYEIKCLQMLNYDVFMYSAYDWITMLLNNGFVFENENCHGIINDIHSYCKKSLASITNKDLFYRYSPYQIAFSLIKITREKFSLNSYYWELLCQVYQTPYSEFQLCYKDIKAILGKKNNNGIESSRNKVLKLKSPITQPLSLHLNPNENNNTRYTIECHNRDDSYNTQKRIDNINTRKMTISVVNPNSQHPKIQTRITKRNNTTIGGTFISTNSSPKHIQTIFNCSRDKDNIFYKEYISDECKHNENFTTNTIVSLKHYSQNKSSFINNNDAVNKKMKLYIDSNQHYNKKVVRRSFVVHPIEYENGLKGKITSKVFINSQRTNTLENNPTKFPLINKEFRQRNI